MCDIKTYQESGDEHPSLHLTASKKTNAAEEKRVLLEEHNDAWPAARENGPIVAKCFIAGATYNSQLVFDTSDKRDHKTRKIQMRSSARAMT